MAELKGSGGGNSSGAGSSGASKTGAVAVASRGAAFSSLSAEKKPAAQSFVPSTTAAATAASYVETAESDAGTWRPDNFGAAAKRTETARIVVPQNAMDTSALVTEKAAPDVLRNDVRVATKFVPDEFAAVELSASSEGEPTPELENQEKQAIALKGGATKPAAKLESAGVETAKPELVAQGEDAGISDAQVAEIKAIVQDEKKFVGGLLEQSSRWQVEGAELRIFFPAEKRAFAELLEARESLEKIRSVAGKVLGRPVRVCAKIESMAAAAAAGLSSSRGTNGGAGQTSARASESDPDLRARFERDPMVRSMMDRFGGKISQVKRAES
jgi:hypothetical protein